MSGMLSPTREKEIIAFCRELVRTRSYSGEEADITKKLKLYFQKMGYDHVGNDEYGNIIGRIKGNRPGRSILFEGHLDTVPVSNLGKWTHNPFEGEIIDGKIYGRGASDMKGALSAMVCAACYFTADTKRDFAGNIYVAGAVHEECFEGIASRKISKKIKPDLVVIGEASECNLKIGQRGRAEIIVETYGKPAHSAYPQNGVNAVYQMNRLIEKIKEIDLPHNQFLGDGILVLTDIKSSPYPGASVIPEYCKATYDRRLLVGETKESVLKPILEIINQMAREDPDFKGKASLARGQERCYTGELIEGERFFPAWLFSEDDEFVKKATQALRKSGLNPEIAYYPFCTNGSHYAGEKGIATIGFGPSQEKLAHIIDEYIEIEQLFKATCGYYEIMREFLR
jgi:putative selenium metabolism hydrolase